MACGTTIADSRPTWTSARPAAVHVTDDYTRVYDSTHADHYLPRHNITTNKSFKTIPTTTTTVAAAATPNNTIVYADLAVSSPVPCAPHPGDDLASPTEYAVIHFVSNAAQEVQV